jgi:hypothetical protein
MRHDETKSNFALRDRLILVLEWLQPVRRQIDNFADDAPCQLNPSGTTVTVWRSP